MLTRRTVLAGLTLSMVLPAGRAMAAQPVFYRSPGCSCCHAWTERMAEAGMPVTLEDSDDLAALSVKYGIPSGLEGCHVGEIGGYVISGHVPPDDIKRLIAEKPDARGLLVPGMPAGSPGMEMGGNKDQFDVLLLGRDGKTTVYTTHA